MSFWLAGLAMMLVIEGLMPLLFPALWRDSFSKLIGLRDGQLRFVGLTATLCGLLMLYWIK